MTCWGTYVSIVWQTNKIGISIYVVIASRIPALSVYIDMAMCLLYEIIFN